MIHNALRVAAQLHLQALSQGENLVQRDIEDIDAERTAEKRVGKVRMLFASCLPEARSNPDVLNHRLGDGPLGSAKAA